MKGEGRETEKTGRGVTRRVDLWDYNGQQDWLFLGSGAETLLKAIIALAFAMLKRSIVKTVRMSWVEYCSLEARTAP